MKFLAIIGSLLVLAATGGYAALALYLGTFYIFADSTVHTDPKVTHSDSKKASMDDAIQLAAKAKDKIGKLKDYECIYLREELVKEKDKEITRSLVVLKVRHEPLSIYMKWLEPETKKDREAGWTSPDKEMYLKKMLFKTLDIDSGLAKGESRRPINDAGMKNMIGRLHTSWEKEKKMEKNVVNQEDAKIEVKLPDGEKHTLECICVIVTHDPEHRETPDGTKLQFQRTKVYFDKKTDLLVRMEAYDWPKKEDEEGRLVERHTFLNLKGDVGLDDKTFKW